MNQAALSKGKPIYEKNARVIVHGRGIAGIVTMVMVGAKNVTRINVTQQKRVKAGQEMGCFNLGSTIVLLL